jgi:uncharacterized protein (TIRG00374 family)
MVDINQLLISLRSIQYPPLLSAILVLLLTLVVRSWRWQKLLNPIRPIKIQYLLSAISIGGMVDMLFPARAGDIVRAYMIGRKAQINKMASFATVIVEKIFDLLTVVLIAISIFIFSSTGMGIVLWPESFEISIYILLLFLITVCIALWLLRNKTNNVLKFISVSLFFLPRNWLDKLVKQLRSFAVGLESIQSSRILIYTILFSLLLWSLFAASNFLIIRSFGLQLPFYAPFLVLAFQILGVTLPSSPGFIGTYHTAVILAFAMFDVSNEMAISVAIIMHAAFFFPLILVGLLFLWKEDLSFQKLRLMNQK